MSSLGAWLLDTGRLESAQLEPFHEERGPGATDSELGEWLLAQSLLAEPELLEGMAQVLDLRFYAHLPDDLLDPALVERVPVDWARSHGLLPIRLPGGRAGVATADPSALEAQDDLALLLGEEVEPVLAPRAAIVEAIERCYFRRSTTPEELSETPEPDRPVPSAGNDLLRSAESAPVAKLLNGILLEAVKARASDIHLEPAGDQLRLRYRVDGVLYEQPSPPRGKAGALVSRLKVMGRLDIAEKRLPQDGMATVAVGERKIDMRISTIPVPGGERVVLRMLDRDATLLPLAELGMPDDLLVQFRALLEGQQGVVLITGPTGSGKTTTLYAALQELDTAHANVLTIEDPIEYQLPNIGQIQVKPKIGLTFAHGLRHILRQDPDVILVGETRDLETAETMVQASMTGHLVFTTLHTTDTAGAVARLADIGVAPYLLSATLLASVAQRLVRQLCPVCRHQRPLTDAERNALGPAASLFDGGMTWEAGSCDACRSGYRGRTGLYEMMVLDEGLQELVRQNASPRQLRQAAREAGMRTMSEAGVAAAAAGSTSLDEVRRVVGLPRIVSP